MYLHLAARNAALLQQAQSLLEALPAAVYGARPRPFERGGIGAHLRHVLDHYDAFLEGVERGRIDYDARRRDAATEFEVEVARERLGATLALLAAFQARGEPAQRALEVSMDVGGRADEAGAARSRSTSSVARELQYLVAHTVHHFALIAVALRLAGHEPDGDFGVAPSTLRHEAESGGACAR